MLLPEPLQQAVRRFGTDDDEDDLLLALAIIQGFGIPRLNSKAKRQVAMLCVLATRRVLFGWTAYGCAGEQPAAAIRAALNWLHTGQMSIDWGNYCLPAPALRNGHIIADCDACRVEPIASAAALVLCEAKGAALEGVELPGVLSFEEWIATIAIPAAMELRNVSDEELCR